MSLSSIPFFIARMMTAAEKLGFGNALQVFLSRFKSEAHITLPDKESFYFRGKKDHGVVYHFFKEGYYIQSDKVRTIIDAGANIGAESRRFSIHNPKAEIVALEIEDNNFKLLAKNATKNIIPLKKALWHEVTTLGIDFGKNPEDHAVTTKPSKKQVKTTTITKIMEEQGWSELDILKMDIEGAEKDIFQPGASWIRKTNVIIFEVGDHQREATTQHIFSSLKDTFNTHIIGENLVLIKKGYNAKAVEVIGFK